MLTQPRLTDLGATLVDGDTFSILFSFTVWDYTSWTGSDLVADVEEKVQNTLQNCSGGNFENFIHKEFSDITTF